jgi:N-acetylglucosamine-6-phosphate deacetylase
MNIGHAPAKSRAGIDAGTTMITHLYNQMNDHHHREPASLEILGGAADENLWNETRILKQAEDGEALNVNERPSFGIPADGNHFHPVSIRLAHLMHSDGLILAGDALLRLGGEDRTIDGS